MKQSNTILPSKEEVDKVMEWISKKKNKDEFYLTPNTTIVNCRGSVEISDEDLVNGKLSIRFGKVYGNFICSGTNITSLKGFPQNVNGYFECCDCEKLTSLKGCPEYVGGDFNIGGCINLTSLKGCPEYVGGHFCCAWCNGLTSFEGTPKEIAKNCYCFGCNNIPEFEDGYATIGGKLVIFY